MGMTIKMLPHGWSDQTIESGYGGACIEKYALVRGEFFIAVPLCT